MQDVRLEKFKNEDAYFIQKNFPNYFKNNNIENIERTIKSWESSLSFCIVYRGEKVGIITLGEKEGGELSFGVMIKEEYRGIGIAQKAFAMIKDKAIEKGYSLIVSSSAVNNIASNKLHEKVGFKLKKTEINQSGREMNRWEMEI